MGVLGVASYIIMGRATNEIPSEGDAVEDDIFNRNGKTIKIQHPLYNEDTEFNKIFKNYSIEADIKVETMGKESSLELARSQPIPITFKIKYSGWHRDKYNNKVNKIIYPTDQFDKIIPTWTELFNAVGGQKEGAEGGIAIQAMSNYKQLVNGSVGWEVTDDSGKKLGYIMLDVASGNINPAMKLGLFTQCGLKTPELVAGSLRSAEGQVESTPAYMAKGSLWSPTITIGTTEISHLNAVCPFVTHEGTSCPPIIGVDTGVTSSAGWTAWTDYEIDTNESNVPFTFTIDTIEKSLLYKYFYKPTKPRIYLNPNGGLFISDNHLNPPDKRTDVMIPCKYIRKMYSCACPDSSANAGNYVDMPQPCSSFNLTATPDAKLMSACGGWTPSGGGSLGGGAGDTVTTGDTTNLSNHDNKKYEYDAEVMKSHHSFITEIL